MKTPSRLLSCLLALMLLPFFGWGSSTRQVRDTLILGDIKYAIDKPPLNLLDSLHFCTLGDRVGFKMYASWNFRGYVATWRINDDKLYLDKLETDSDKADFRDVLKDFDDGSGNIFASWFTGTIICGTGPVLCISGNGWDDLNETEIELTIESGVVTSSREYRNKVHKGSGDRSSMLQQLPKSFDYSAFTELKGLRITTKISPSKYDEDGTILDWNVEYLKWPEAADPAVKDRLADAIKKELQKYDWRTYCADGRWFWHNRNHFDGIYWPILFKK